MGKIGKKYDQPNYHIPIEKLKNVASLKKWIREEILVSEYAELGSYLDSGETLTVLVSGSLNPQEAHSYGGFNDIIAGFDWFRHETIPKPDETEINIYHHVVRKPDENGICRVYRIRDPNVEPLDHWFEVRQIDSIQLGPDSIK